MKRSSSRSKDPARADGDGRIRVLRVIARLNVGGPAHHVTILSERLDPGRYRSVLLIGATGPGEDTLEPASRARGIDVRRVPGFGPVPRPLDDLRALVAIARHVRRFRPDVVHTHTAKAGMLGRVAARVALGRRPVVVHTYHGHVLRGYFGPRTEAVYRGIERALARLSTRLIGVSDATVSELVALGVAPRARFTAVPVGLELEPFLAVEPATGGLRDELGAGPETLVATFVGRLVAIKRVELLIAAVQRAREAGADVRLAIAGDGELRAELEARAAPLGGAVRFLGFRDDIAALAAGTDVAVLSSDNEGTPVALIEAAAAGVPAIATDVGGVADIVLDGTTGWLVAPGDPAALAGALVAAAGDRAGLRRRGLAAREHVRDRYGAARLVADVDALYVTLLAERGAARAPRG
ncbi:MAG TPA: glycosyltransferase [Baekduia sp.]